VTIWLDAQISPALASWVATTFGCECQSVRELGLRDATDTLIFSAARLANAVVISKDSDFADLVKRLGPPPQVIWLRCGNTTNTTLQQLLQTHFTSITTRLADGEVLIELQ